MLLRLRFRGSLGGAVALVCLLIAASGCDHPDFVTYRPGWRAYETTGGKSQQLWLSWCEQKKRELPASATWPNGWHFVLGEEWESLQPVFRTVVGDTVSLPHRILQPNRALWYARKIEVTEPGVLIVNADDGAQLFLNGNLQPRLHDHYFALPVPGSYEITLRVLNNAMSGGLRQVSFATASQFSRFKIQQARWEHLDDLVWRARLCNNPTEKMLGAVAEAIRDTSQNAIDRAEAVWHDFPYLFGPWVVMTESDSFCVRVWTEPGISVRLQAGFERGQMNYDMSASGPHIQFCLASPTEADTLYYRLAAGRTLTPVYAVPVRSNSFEFDVWADSQSGWETFAAQMGHLQKGPAAFGVAAGDLVGNGSSERDWKHFFRIAGDVVARMPYAFVPGNHDYDGYYDDLRPTYFDLFFGPSPHHRFWTLGNCAFLSIDLNGEFPINLSEKTNQGQWIADHIKKPAWQQADWRFLVVHHPPYSQGWFGYEGERCLRDFLTSVAVDADLDFVISGHTHDYERLTLERPGGSTTYLIVGGAGGSLEPAESSALPAMDIVIKKHHMGRFRVRGDQIQFTAFGVDREVLDSFSRQKR